MDILIGRSEHLAPGILHEVAKYRYKVFVEKLGWKLANARDGFELDQFDRNDTIHLALREDDGEIAGTARLLSTARPYLLGEVFPYLMPGGPPQDPKVWELSRFAATGEESALTGALSQFASAKVVALLDAVLCLALAHGVHRLITVSPLGIERLLRRYGFTARRAGPPTVVDGQLLFACWIETGLGSRQHCIDPARTAFRLPEDLKEWSHEACC